MFFDPPSNLGGQVRGPQGSHNGSWEVRPPQGRSEQRRPEGRHSWSERGGYRGQHIREDHYRTRFGIGHYFRPYWYNGVFVYAGYQIILVDEWPGDWYGDDVYVVFETDGYYLYSHVHPGIGIRVIIAF